MPGGSITSGERSVVSGARGGGGYGSYSPAATTANPEAMIMTDHDGRAKRIEEEVDRRAYSDARRLEGCYFVNAPITYEYVLF